MSIAGRGCRVLALLAAAALAGAAPPSRFDSALGYLTRTTDEFGADAALLLEVVADLTGDERAGQIAEIRRLGFGREKIGSLAPLFGLDKPVLARAAAPPPERRAAGAVANLFEAFPVEEGGDRLSTGRCVERAAACRLSPACIDFADDARATGLDTTHQAIWLLFVRWRACRTELDLDRLQAGIAGRLLSELERENRYSEVHLERVATLGQLGYSEHFDPEWLRTILVARDTTGCWGPVAGGPCHPHSTVLALWALALGERAGKLPAGY